MTLIEVSRTHDTAAQNRSNIITAFRTINNSRSENDGVFHCPLDVQERLHFLYSTAESDLQPTILRVIRTQIFDARENMVAAYRFYSFWNERDNSILVRSVTHTMQAYESQGFGSGLTALTSEVIGEAINRFAELEGREVVSMIQDKALGSTDAGMPARNRNGWSSHMAREMGYVQSENEPGVWRKVFRSK